MKNSENLSLRNGDFCEVTAGVHKGKIGTVQDLHTSKTGHITVTIVQNNGIKFKTLGRSVKIIPQEQDFLSLQIFFYILFLPQLAGMV